MTLAYSLLFFIGLPLITQALHIFTFPIIAAAYVGYILVLLYVHRKKINSKGVAECIQKMWLVARKHWMVVVALIIVTVQLSSIHLFYTGTVTSADKIFEVTNSYYPYPYFSDEWVTAGLVKYTIQNHSLATVNPFDHNRYFPNILIVFPSVISQFFLIIGANPITSYWVLGLLISLLNIFLVYLILCTYNVNRYISAIGLFGLSNITNSGNLPTFWTFLPISLSLTFLFLALLSEKKGERLPMYIYSLIALSIYPPLIVFVLPVLIADLWNIKQTLGSKKFLKFGAGIVGTLIILVALFLVTLFSHQGKSLLSIFLGYVIRPNLDPGIPAYYVWNIIPIFFILFAIPGIYFAFKKRYYVLLAPSIVGMMYWIVYLYLNKVIIIEYPRIIFVTSICIIMLSCIGIDEIIKSKPLWVKAPVIIYSFVVVITLLLLPRYSSGQAWKKLVLTVYDNTGKAYVFMPSAPITRYLTEDDLELFKNIHGESFVAPPWKGLTIGVATGNFPLETKSSTITNQVLTYNTFMSFDCDTKARALAFFHTTYAYTQPFSCPQFKVIGTSTEGLYLTELEQK